MHWGCAYVSRNHSYMSKNHFYAPQAYFAAASFMDAQLAKVMGAMENLELMDNTVIALWG